jgi:hypothetical protein
MISDEKRHDELVRARCALDVAYAQYQRALTLAKTANQAERAAAYAEARRLLRVAVTLRHQADALKAEDIDSGHAPKPRRPV